MPHQMLKVESASIFVSDTWEALLDKIGNTKFQGLSSTTVIFKDFKGTCEPCDHVTLSKFGRTMSDDQLFPALLCTTQQKIILTCYLELMNWVLILLQSFFSSFCNESWLLSFNWLKINHEKIVVIGWVQTSFLNMFPNTILLDINKKLVPSV